VNQNLALLSDNNETPKKDNNEGLKVLFIPERRTVEHC
jgi:hypothetical protein